MRHPRFVTSVVTLFLLATSTSIGLAAQGSVTVVPNEGSATAVENTLANHVTFTITNAAADTDHADNFELTCSVAGAVTACETSTEAVFLEAQEQTSVTVTFATTSAGKGVVALIAWGSNWRGYDPAHYMIAVESAGTP